MSLYHKDLPCPASSCPNWRTGTVLIALLAALIAPVSFSQAIDSVMRQEPQVNPATSAQNPTVNKRLRAKTFDFSESSVLHIQLPVLLQDPASLNKLNSRSKALQVGIHRDIPPIYKGDLSKTIEWVEEADGYSGSLMIKSEDAQALRVAMSADLPEGSEVQVFPLDDTLTGSNPLDAGSTFLINGKVNWFPTVQGDGIGIRLFVPTTEEVDLRLSQVSHHFRGRFQEGGFELDGCQNHQNTACAIIEEDDEFDGYSQTTGLILFERDGSTYRCTATQMNDRTEGSFIPFLLTAKHCVDDQDSADSLEVVWNYRTSECDTKALDPKIRRNYAGAYHLVSDVNQDVSLLKLKDQYGGARWLAGWDFSSDSIEVGKEVINFHHPLGQEQKLAEGSIESIVQLRACDESGRDCLDIPNAINVLWEDGATEQGSSGSALRSNGRVVGVLSSGGDECTPSDSQFSSLSESSSKISDWLIATDNDDHGNEEETATTVQLWYGTSRGNIEHSKDVDYFKVTLNHDGKLTAYTESEIDTYGTVSGEDFQRIDDDGGEGSNFHIDANLVAGTYFISVRTYVDSGDTGEYRLKTEYTREDASDDGTEAIFLPTLPSYEVESLGKEGDVDWFFVFTPAKGTLTVRSLGSTDVACDIVRPSDRTSATDDDSYLGENCQVSLSGNPDFYFVRIYGSEESVTGEYELFLSFQYLDDHGNTTEDATPISSKLANWALSTVSYLASEDVDMFQIDLSYEGSLSLESEGELDLVGRLHNDLGEEIAFNDDSGMDKNFRMTENLAVGTYFFEVEGYFDDTEGHYKMNFSFDETF